MAKSSSEAGLDEAHVRHAANLHADLAVEHHLANLPTPERTVHHCVACTYVCRREKPIHWVQTHLCFKVKTSTIPYIINFQADVLQSVLQLHRRTPTASLPCKLLQIHFWIALRIVSGQ